MAKLTVDNRLCQSNQNLGWEFHIVLACMHCLNTNKTRMILNTFYSGELEKGLSYLSSVDFTSFWNLWKEKSDKRLIISNRQSSSFYFVVINPLIYYELYVGAFFRHPNDQQRHQRQPHHCVN